jgi:hypothetical protein
VVREVDLVAAEANTLREQPLALLGVEMLRKGAVGP